jgi:DsbC/DsbD-like thiol-disulfide interchange protein
MTSDRARAALILANLVVLVAAPPALAADASPWDGSDRAAVRLIAGASIKRDGATMHRAGVGIRLAPGWKTYWRYPGDSGLPPRFDFSGSRNVKAVTVRWPMPQRLADEAGTSIGYKHDVVFPLEVTPQDGAKPVMLALKVDYAVCEKLCVPADGKAALTLTGEPGRHDETLRHAESLVPKAATVGDNGTPGIRMVKREGARVIVDVAAPTGVPVDLFAEGPAADWALPVPSPIAGAPAGQQRFAFELDGLPPGAKPDGAALTLTATAGERAIEVPYRLD